VEYFGYVLFLHFSVDIRWALWRGEAIRDIPGDKIQAGLR